MKKIAILILSILIAGLFVACNQDITVDAQTYANMEVGTFVLNGQNYATLQEAVNAKLGKSAKAVGDNDGVIYLTRNASGPGAVIDQHVEGGVIIDFAGYTYSFTNVTGLQGGDNPKADTFGLGITNGADVTLKGLEQIDLNDRSTTDLTMVYVAGQNTKLTIEDAPKMKVEDDQYVFWAADGATLTIGSTTTTSEKTEITGKIAATGTNESKPVVSFNNDTKINASELKADSAVVVINTSEASTIDSFVGANEANIVVSGKGNVTVTKNDSGDGTYEIENTSSSSETKVEVPTKDGSTTREITPGYKVDNNDNPTEDTNPSVAMIGSTLYSSLVGTDGAIDKASGGDTIVLLKDITVDGVVINKSITIDGNGKKITQNGTSITRWFVFVTPTSSSVTANLKNLEVESVYGNTSEQSAFAVLYDSSAEYKTTGTVENCKVTGPSVGLASAGSPISSNHTFNGSEVTVINSTISSTGNNTNENGIYNAALSPQMGGVINVVSGSFDGIWSIAEYTSMGRINIEGGSFSGPILVYGDAGYTDYSSNEKNSPFHLVKVSGSENPTFNMTKKTAEGSKYTAVSSIEDYANGFVFKGTTTNNPNKLTLSCGTYSVDPSEYVAEGYEAKDNGDETWTVVEKDPVAMIGEAKYLTLQSAVDAAMEGQTVQLLKSITGISSVRVDDTKDLTIDLYGYSIETGFESEGRHYYAFDNYGSLTLKNSKTTGGIYARGAVNNYGGNLTIESGYYKAVQDTADGGAVIWNENTQQLNGYYISSIDFNNAIPEEERAEALENLASNGIYVESFDLDQYSYKYIGFLPLEPSGKLNVYRKSVPGKVTINGGSFIVEKVGSTSDSSGVACIINNGGNVEINAGSFISPNERAYNIIDKWGSMVINNATVEGAHGGIAIDGGELILNSEIYSTSTDYYGIWVTNNYANVRIVVNGGSYSGKIGLNASVDDGNQDAADVEIIVNDGTFTGTSVSIKNNTKATEHVWDMKLYGGTYSSDPSAYVAKGYVARKTGDVWIVKNADTEEVEADGTKMSLVDFAKSVNSGNTYAGKTVTLLKDVDLTGVTWTPIGCYLDDAEDGTPNGRFFAGCFNGGGHTVKGLTITNISDDHSLGLFGRIKNTDSVVIISNLKLTDVNIDVTNGKHVGSIVGFVDTGTKGFIIEDVEVFGSVSAKKHVGGIVGKCYASNDVVLRNCINNAKVTSINDADNYSGGVAGYVHKADNVSFINCKNTGTINCDYSSTKIGGIVGGVSVGKEKTLSFDACVNTGKVSSQGTGNSTPGGIIGYPLGGQPGMIILNNCSNTGTISGVSASGMIGYVESHYKDVKLEGTLINEGTVSGTTGRVAGIISSCSPTNSITIAEGSSITNIGTVSRTSGSGDGYVADLFNVGGGTTQKSVNVAATYYRIYLPYSGEGVVEQGENYTINNFTSFTDKRVKIGDQMIETSVVDSWISDSNLIIPADYINAAIYVGNRVD